MSDFESDERDGVLFRFWIRAASYPDGFPAETGASLANCSTPAEYRRALTELAERKRINLPGPQMPKLNVTDAMIDAALAKSKDKALNTLTNSNAMRAILEAALSAEEPDGPPQG